MPFGVNELPDRWGSGLAQALRNTVMLPPEAVLKLHGCLDEAPCAFWPQCKQQLGSVFHRFSRLPYLVQGVVVSRWIGRLECRADRGQQGADAVID